ncbi:MAG: outer membrane beta-barrel protein [Bacteroidales bacterium]|nr:outer membrane beta-barrel protein [Bacteroidales bacterium]
MKKVTATILLLIVAFSAAYPQSTAWKRDRNSVFGGIGYNFFMGELGGGKKDAAHFFGIRDVDLASTRPAMQVGYRYRILEPLSARASFTYCRIYGDDSESANIYRKARNLNFRSDLFQFGATIDYYFVKEKAISRFGAFQSVSQWRQRISAYVFTGIGAVHFKPKGELDGSWYDLQPLCTEGQGSGVTLKVVDENGNTITIKTESKPYKLWAATVPIGLGVKYRLNPKMALSLEIANHYTTTDYIDDVSSDYYFNYEQEGVQPPSDLTPKFADRHFDVDNNGELVDASAPYKSGHMRRGNSGYNDAYLVTMICFHYKLSENILPQRKPKYY